MKTERSIRGSEHSPRASPRPRGLEVILTFLLLLAAMLGAPTTAAAQSGAPSASAASRAPGVLRVGTSGDYAPFSWTDPGEDALRLEPGESASGWALALPPEAKQGWALAPPPEAEQKREASPLEGFDITIARAYAKARRMRIHWVHFRWPQLVADLEAGRFDVAMGGITLRPERAIAGRFTVPVAESGAMALVAASGDTTRPDQLNRPGVLIAVNAGGHLERVARQRFPRATILPIDDNARVIEQLDQGDADAVITDTLEAPVWSAGRPGLRTIGPFTSDLKAYLVGPQQRELAADLDRWLLGREADASLAALRRRYLGEASIAPTAEPLAALVAAVGLRLALMPYVADAKRREGLPVEVPEREAQVVDSALAAVHRAAARENSPRPEEHAIRAFYRAQISAAKAIQRRVLEEDARSSIRAPADLQAQLRPALLRLGEHMSELLVKLAGSCDPDDARAFSAQKLEQRGLDVQSSARIAAPLGSLCKNEGGLESQ